DGKIADFRSYSKWITSEESRKRVHRLRSEVDAVLVGGNSVRLDNPELTCHGVADHDPLRLVLTRSVDFDNKLKVFAGNPQPPTVLITADNAEPSLPVAKWQLTGDSDSRVDLGDLLQKAGKERICSLLVEGGRELFSGFIQAGLVDKYIFVIAPRLLGSGTAAFEEEKVKRSLQESVNIRIDRVEQRGADIWIEGYPE
ncbi:MAG: RibD family protein, partial [candidate division Zixibacteria bacterium]|nr:RibD family protein [candidate division Zixibacteria bacterium]